MNKELLTPRDDIFVVRNYLSAEECDKLIDRIETIGFKEATINTSVGATVNKGMRNNERVIVDDVLLANNLWEKIKDLVPEKYGCLPIGLNERFRFYRYEPKQFFDWHFDGHFERNHKERSMLTFMVYLNECEGGTTDFTFKTGVVNDDDAEIRVKPEKGMALVFIHSVFHRGAPVTEGKKYVLRSDVMYRG